MALTEKHLSLFATFVVCDVSPYLSDSQLHPPDHLVVLLFSFSYLVYFSQLFLSLPRLIDRFSFSALPWSIRLPVFLTSLSPIICLTVVLLLFLVLLSFFFVFSLRRQHNTSSMSIARAGAAQASARGVV